MPNLYETLLIVTPEADDEGINAVIGDLRSVVDANEGTMLQARIWERNRKLAYQVKGKTEGHFVLLHSEGSTDLPQLLKAKMKLDEAVIRSIVVRLEGPHEAVVRKELEEIEGDSAAGIAQQMAAAERRAVARAAAATRTTAEVVADEEALEAQLAAAAAAAAAATPAIIGEDSSATAPPIEATPEETPEGGTELDLEEAPSLEDEAPEDSAAAEDDEPTASRDAAGAGEEIPEETAPQADGDEAVADEEEKES